MSKNNIGKPKAAILTWCDNNGRTNYGQILQCYAMQYLVKKAGYIPLVVQYRRKDSRDLFRYQFSNRTLLGRLLNERYERHFNLKVVEGEKSIRVKRFKNFINQYIPLSPPCYTKKMVEEMTKDCKVLICGSDQIWNPIYFDPIWFLDFGKPEQKRVAYAPSGVFYDKPEYEKYYQKMAPMIERFDEVSVREKAGADILKRYVKKEVKVKADPTLRLSKEQWNRIASQRIVEGRYIFCYLLGSFAPYQMILKELMKKHRAEKIIYIPSNLLPECGNLKKYIPYHEAGPAEFLSLIKFSEAVCTDSFHGTAISIVYGIPFYNVSRIHKEMGDVSSEERINNLIEQKGLEKRWVRDVQDVRKIADAGK